MLCLADVLGLCVWFFFFSSRRRHTRCLSDWSSDVCSSDLASGDDAAADGPLSFSLFCGTIGFEESVRSASLAAAFEAESGVFFALPKIAAMLKIGRASCRERVKISLVAGSV